MDAALWHRCDDWCPGHGSGWVGEHICGGAPSALFRGKHHQVVKMPSLSKLRRSYGHLTSPDFKLEFRPVIASGDRAAFEDSSPVYSSARSTSFSPRICQCPTPTRLFGTTVLYRRARRSIMSLPYTAHVPAHQLDQLLARQQPLSDGQGPAIPPARYPAGVLPRTLRASATVGPARIHLPASTAPVAVWTARNQACVWLRA